MEDRFAHRSHALKLAKNVAKEDLKDLKEIAKMTHDTELLPCPFCGCSGTMEEIKDTPTQTRGVMFSVGCCDDSGECMGYQSLQSFDRRSDAIKAWNTRHNADQATNEALKYHLEDMRRLVFNPKDSEGQNET